MLFELRIGESHGLGLGLGLEAGHLGKARRQFPIALGIIDFPSLRGGAEPMRAGDIILNAHEREGGLLELEFPRLAQQRWRTGARQWSGLLRRAEWNGDEPGSQEPNANPGVHTGKKCLLRL